MTLPRMTKDRVRELSLMRLNMVYATAVLLKVVVVVLVIDKEERGNISSLNHFLFQQHKISTLFKFVI